MLGRDISRGFLLNNRAGDMEAMRMVHGICEPSRASGLESGEFAEMGDAGIVRVEGGTAIRA